MVDAVAVKLPLFWTTSPTAWFAQAVAQFAIRNITTDDTKYYYVVSALDNATATRAVSLLSAPPAQHKYSAIKTFLTGAYELSECERAAALFNLHGLGDSNPSELMDSMLALLGPHTPCFLFLHLFLQQLPEYVRGPLSVSGIKDYRALAQEADKIFLSGRPHLQEVNIPKSQQHNSQPSDICRYHHRFGTKARNCWPNCKHYSTFCSSKKTPGNSSQGQR